MDAVVGALLAAPPDCPLANVHRAGREGVRLRTVQSKFTNAFYDKAAEHARDFRAIDSHFMSELEVCGYPAKTQDLYVSARSFWCQTRDGEEYCRVFMKALERCPRAPVNIF